MAPLCRSHDLLRDQLSPDPNLNRVAVEAAEAAHIMFRRSTRSCFQ